MKMKIMLFSASAIAAVGLTAATVNNAKNLIENGDFNDPDNPTRGWVVDYKWTDNIQYIDNLSKISVVPSEDGRTNVMRLVSDNYSGTKAESSLIAFDPNCRYRASVFVKGGPFRMYIAGYQWKPGIRPHDDPQPEELRMVYRGKTETGDSSNSWQHVVLEMPGTNASPASIQHLQKVRFIRLFALFIGTGFMDDAVLAKIE